MISLEGAAAVSGVTAGVGTLMRADLGSACRRTRAELQHEVCSRSLDQV